MNRTSRFARVFLLGAVAISVCRPALWAQSPCDLNKDGSVNVTDVTLAVNMALGTSTCTGSVTGTGGCNVVLVQRVVGAALPGGTCHPTILNWVGSASSVAGYNVYRSTSSGGTYTKLNSTLLTVPNFTDTTSQAGQTYFYAATSVDVSGNESARSTPVQAVIPTP